MDHEPVTFRDTLQSVSVVKYRYRTEEETMDKNIIARITVGPDWHGDGEGGPAWSGAIVTPEGTVDCIDGARGHGPRTTTPGRYPTPDQWFRLVKRHTRLPRVVKRAGLGWADADVEPYGWSPGPGCAPHGVRVTWRRS